MISIFILKGNHWVLVYFSSKPMSPLFSQLPEKVLYTNGLYINSFQTILRNVCLSAILEFCLLSLARLQPTPAYVEIWNICWKYHILSKIILTWPNFWFSLFGLFDNIALCLKKITRKWTEFVFGKT